MSRIYSIQRRLRIAILVFGLPAVPLAWYSTANGRTNLGNQLPPNVWFNAGYCTDEGRIDFIERSNVGKPPEEQIDAASVYSLIEWRSGDTTGYARPNECRRMDPALAAALEVRCVAFRRRAMLPDVRLAWSNWIGPPDHSQTPQCDAPGEPVSFWSPPPRATVLAAP